MCVDVCGGHPPPSGGAWKASCLLAGLMPYDLPEVMSPSPELARHPLLTDTKLGLGN